jgi:sulfide:quinone oxidoreductase
MNDSYEVLIVGGGTAGLTVASQLCAREDAPEVALLEPSDEHYYQPLWTLVGGGVFPKEESMRREGDLIPDGATWIRDAAASFDPEAGTVTTEGGATYGYDYLVVAPGLDIDWDAIPGVAETVGKPGTGVVSNYAYDTCESTWQAIQAFPKGGTALFTEPTTGVKCGGAPQKIMYLADDAFRRQGVREGSQVWFVKAKGALFSVAKYEKTLYEIVERKGIDVKLNHELVAVKPDAKEAVINNLESGEEMAVPFDLLHVVPPMGPFAFVAESPLADDDGWVDVDKHTLRHVRYENVFSLGDAANLPTSKTGAAVRKQAPVVVDHLMASMRGTSLSNGRYDGYTSCPLVTGYGKLVLAEFDYDKQPDESFPFDQSRERYSMYALKAYGLPRMYWNGMLRGRM